MTTASVTALSEVLGREIETLDSTITSTLPRRWVKTGSGPRDTHSLAAHLWGESASVGFPGDMRVASGREPVGLVSSSASGPWALVTLPAAGDDEAAPAAQRWRIHTVGSGGVADGYWSQKVYTRREAAQRDAARDERGASIRLIVLPA